MPALIQQTYEGKNVRQWRVSRPDGKEMVTVRESAIAPGVYCCLSCICIDCEHVNAVRAIDGATSLATA